MNETGSGPRRAGACRRGALLGALLCAVSLAGCGGDVGFISYYEQANLERELEINGSRITVDTATTEQQRSMGLQHRPSLPPDHGMLFVFPKTEHQRFGMKETYIDLDVAFLSVEWDDTLENGQATVVNIEQMARHEELPGAISHEEVSMALQTTRGWFASKGITAGTTFTLPQWAADLRVE